MIITKTPLRICFFSGGSDMPAFYTQEVGASLSATINQYIYCIVHNTPRIGFKMMHDTVEECQDLTQMQNIICRETLKYFKVEKGVTVASISDINSKGSGLGSSSAFTVGLSLAASVLKNNQVPEPGYLATTACEIEMEKCGFPVGRQDQYAAAYGGLNLFQFLPSHRVTVESIRLPRAGALKKLNDNLLLVYSGKGRSANEILQKQKSAMSQADKFNLVKRSRDKAYKGLQYLENDDLDSFGYLLHEGWMDKKNIVKEITQDYFDDIYTKAIDAGALGGKLLGAGGGGFFLFYCKPELQQKVLKAVQENTSCVNYPFKFTDHGSSVVSLYDAAQ
jgi:D-glycero-alpha-D-manno-heptose-7-phosphate kinase